MNNKNKNGFTLVELLATLAVISVLLSITIYTFNSLINSAKEKTYLTTISEIEKAAGSYSNENSQKLFFIKNNDKEYQCITIQDLIDYGFLNNNITSSRVSKDKNVTTLDYVYIERDSKTKSVRKQVYVNDNNGFNSRICTNSYNAYGNIIYTLNPKEWSKSKSVNIKYELKNVNSRRNYEYWYYYSARDSKYNIANTITYENSNNVNVLDTGTMNASIIYSNNNEKNEIVSKTLSISKIDNVGPKITLVDNTVRYFSKSASILLNISDCDDNKCSGLNEDILDSNKLASIVKNNIIVKIGSNVVSSNNVILKKETNSRYSLIINDSSHDGKVTIEIKEDTFVDKVYEEEKNGNEYTILHPNIFFDNTKPTLEYISTNSDFSNSQDLTIKCEDNFSLIGYYYGKEDVNDTTTYSEINGTSNSFKTNVTEAGDYYLACKDTAGNITKEKVDYYSYTIKGMLLNFDGKSNTYNLSNYSEVSSKSFLSFEGNSITLSKVENYLNSMVPLGSNINHYVGYSKNANNNNNYTVIKKDKTSVNDFVINSNYVYRFWFERNMLNVKYRVNSGENLISGNYDSDIYSWTLEDSIVKRTKKSNGEETTFFHNYRYNDSSIAINLFDNAKNGYFAIEKVGYSPKSGSEWKCVSGCITNNLEITQSTHNVDVNNTICNISNSDCTIILSANFVASTYTISYNMNGATAKSNENISFDTVKTIVNPTKSFKVNIDANGQGATIKNSGGTAVTSASANQTFAGWTSNSGAGLGTNAKIGTSATGATTSWTGSATKNTYFKNLRDTSGTVTLTATWTAVNVTLPTITKTGYTCGYAETSGGTIKYNSGANYTPSATAGSVTLYAKCNVNKVNVKYHMNGGTLASNVSGIGTSGSFITVNGSTVVQTFNSGSTLGGKGLINYNYSGYVNITRSGYIAKPGAEWVKNANGTGDAFDHGSADIVADDLCDASQSSCDVTLYVNWVQQVTASFDCTTNGGKGNVASVGYSHNSGVTLPTSGCTKSGWTFVGWNTNKNATTKLNSYTIGNSDVTLYAIYSKECTINYYGNGFYIGKTTNTSADNYNSLTCDDSSNSCVSKCTRYNNQTSCGVRTPVIDELSNKKFFSPNINDQRPWTADSDQLYRDATFGCKESFDGNDYYVPNDYVNGDRYNCQNYTQYTDFNNKHRTAIYHITTCNGLLCNYNKINSIGSGSDFSLELTGNPNSNQPPWTVLRSELSFDFEDGCAVSYYATQNVNCYSSIGSNTVAMTLSRCTSITSYRTTKRIDQSGGTNWYYLSEGKCYINGAYLQTPVPSGCSGDAPTVTNGKNSVILNPNGGTWASGSGNKKVSYEDRLNLSEFPRISRSGYRLTGWNINSPSGTLYTYYVDAADNGKTLYAHWTQSSSGGSSGGSSSSSSGSGYSYCYCSGSGYMYHGGRCYTRAGAYNDYGMCQSAISYSLYGLCTKLGTGYQSWISSASSPKPTCK